GRIDLNFQFIRNISHILHISFLFVLKIEFYRALQKAKVPPSLKDADGAAQARHVSSQFLFLCVIPHTNFTTSSFKLLPPAPPSLFVSEVSIITIRVDACSDILR